MAPSGTRPDLPIGVARFAISGRYNTSPWVNVFHVRLDPSGAITVANFDTLGGAILAAFSARMRPLAHTSWQVTNIRGVCKTGPEVAVHTDTSNVSAGTAVGNNLPSSISACISWLQPLYYRGGHPRTYLTGHTYTQQGTEREWSAAYRTAVQAAAIAFRGDVNAATGGGVTTVELGMLSFVKGGAYRASALFVPFTGATVDTRIDTQRRRLGRDT